MKDVAGFDKHVWTWWSIHKNDTQKHPIMNGKRLEFLYLNTSINLSDSDYEQAALELNCEGDAIKAVALTETGSSGSFFDYYENLVPSILFERHYFSKLTNHIYDETHPTISNPIRGGYGKFSAQYDKLLCAYDLNPSAELKSASWGRFQIMGNNYKLCKYNSVEEFVYDLSLSEANQLSCFVAFIKNNSKLHNAIKNKDWLTFALNYNDPGQQGYDIRMKESYEKLKI
jgi:hypothetical protein